MIPLQHEQRTLNRHFPKASSQQAQTKDSLAIITDITRETQIRTTVRHLLPVGEWHLLNRPENNSIRENVGKREALYTIVSTTSGAAIAEGSMGAPQNIKNRTSL